MKATISVLNEKVWITWAAFDAVEVNSVYDLQRVTDGGKLPDQLTDKEIVKVRNTIHRLRKKPSPLVSHISRIIYSLALLLSIFWLGTGLLYQMQFGTSNSLSAVNDIKAIHAEGVSCSAVSSRDLPGFTKEKQASIASWQNLQLHQATKARNDLSNLNSSLSREAYTFDYPPTFPEHDSNTPKFEFGYDD